MAYKNPEKQKAAQRRSYEKHREKISKSNGNRRKELGVYKKGRKLTLASYVNERKDAPCADCAGSFHYCQMDFDHVRGEKLASVSQLLAYGYGKVVIDKEIEKCDLVCANCHRLRTWDRLMASYDQ